MLHWLLSLALFILPVATASSQDLSSLSSQKSRQTPPGLSITFDGGLVGVNMAQVLDLVYQTMTPPTKETMTPPTKEYVVNARDTLCGILVSQGYPSPCEPFVQFLSRLNGRATLVKGIINQDDKITLPDLNLTRTKSGRVFYKNVERDSRQSSDVLENFRDLNVRRTDQSGNLYAVEYDAYQIYIPTQNDEESSILAKRVLSLQSANILVDIIRKDLLDVKPHSVVPLNRLRADCPTGHVLNFIYDYRDLSDYETDALTIMNQGIHQAAPVSVFLIDVALLKSPNLYPAFGDPPVTTIFNCNWSSFDRTIHHATHLAGIIASKESFGFRGLAPKTTIQSIEWAVPRNDGSGELKSSNPERQSILANLIPDRSFDRPINIFLAALSFDGWDDPQANTLPNDLARFTRRLEQNIRRWQPLFVVAAGQPDVGHLPVALTPQSTLFPQNLGDLPMLLSSRPARSARDQIQN